MAREAVEFCISEDAIVSRHLDLCLGWPRIDLVEEDGALWLLIRPAPDEPPELVLLDE
jgi:hypothetical protein